MESSGSFRKIFYYCFTDLTKFKSLFSADFLAATAAKQLFILLILAATYPLDCSIDLDNAILFEFKDIVLINLSVTPIPL